MLIIFGKSSYLSICLFQYLIVYSSCECKDRFGVREELAWFRNNVSKLTMRLREPLLTPSFPPPLAVLLSTLVESGKWSRSVVSDSLWPRGLEPTSFSVHGISQARVREWVAIAFSRGSSWPRSQTRVSRIAGRRFTLWAT